MSRTNGVVLLLVLLSQPANILAAPSPIQVHGHRGARARRAENTLPAFEYALSVGVDVIELDLAVTADDVLVVSHDPVINPARCRSRKGPIARNLKIRSLTLEQVKRFDCGSLRHADFPRQKRSRAQIPTLDEVLQLVKKSRHKAARSVELNIETKIVPGYPDLAPKPRRFASLVISLLRRHGMIRRSMLQSFDHRALAAARKLAPRLRRVALSGESRPNYVAVARAVGAFAVSPHHRWITAKDVTALHSAGIKVVPWTANKLADWKRLIALGVDGIITDDPSPLISFLRSR